MERILSDKSHLLHKLVKRRDGLLLSCHGLSFQHPHGHTEPCSAYQLLSSPTKGAQQCTYQGMPCMMQPDSPDFFMSWLSTIFIHKQRHCMD